MLFLPFFIRFTILFPQYFLQLFLALVKYCKIRLERNEKRTAMIMLHLFYLNAWQCSWTCNQMRNCAKRSQIVIWRGGRGEDPLIYFEVFCYYKMWYSTLSTDWITLPSCISYLLPSFSVLLLFLLSFLKSKTKNLYILMISMRHVKWKKKLYFYTKNITK